MDVFIYRVRKYIGSYIMALNGHVDALVFSAGAAAHGARAHNSARDRARKALRARGAEACAPSSLPFAWTRSSRPPFRRFLPPP